MCIALANYKLLSKFRYWDVQGIRQTLRTSTSARIVVSIIVVLRSLACPVLAITEAGEALDYNGDKSIEGNRGY